MQHHDTSGETTLRSEPSTPPLLLRQPRALILGVFVVALLFALLVPVVQLWRVSVTPLDAQACIWPRVPRVGQPAQIVVTLPANLDHGDRNWTRAIAEWDMVSMRMGVRRAAAAPASAQSAIAIPLALEMAGVWVAHVKAESPGRPDWTVTLTFDAQGADRGSDLALKKSSASAVAGCAEPPAQVSRLVGGSP